MLLERIPTCWPAVQHGVPTNYRAEPLADAHTGSAPSTRIVQGVSTREDDAPPVQSVAEHGTTRTSVREDVLAGEHTTQATSGADDQHIALMSIAEVLALAPTAGATGAMGVAAGVAPPPPAQSSAATAAPNANTIHTAAAAAEDAQLAKGVDESYTDVEAGGIESDGTDDEGADDNDRLLFRAVSFLAHHFSAFGAAPAWPRLAADIYNGGVEDAAPSKRAFILSPVDWSRVDAAGRYVPTEDSDLSTTSDED